MRQVILLTLLGLTACASMIEGKMQSITVHTKPEGATCEFIRDKSKIGEITTPGFVTVYKTNLDITINCRKDNLVGRYSNEADIAVASFGNVLTNVAVLPVGIVGSIMDTGSGASHKYESTVTIPLREEGNPQGS